MNKKKVSHIDILHYLGSEVWEPIDEFFIVGANSDKAMFYVLSMILPSW